MLRTRHRLSSLFISFDARNQAFQFRSNMHHREGGDFIRRAGNDFASLTNIFVSTFESLRSWGSFNLETKLVNWFFFSFFLLIFCDNRGKKRVEYYFYTRDSRFPRLITRTKWTRISWIPSIDFLSVETMSGRSYSEIRWRPTGEFRRNARINQQGSYSMPVRNLVCNL